MREKPETDDGWNEIDIATFLLIAEAVTGVPAETLATPHVLSRAESAIAAPAAGFGDFEKYPALAKRAAVICSRIVRNHPLPDGNKRTAFLCMLEYISTNGSVWIASPDDPAETASLIEQLAAGELPENDFANLIERRIAAA